MSRSDDWRAALQRTWWSRPAPGWARPLEWLYCSAVWARRRAYGLGLKGVVSLPAPVWVVGNLTVGGTGKTPLVAWLAQALLAAGKRPGIISRGYGGHCPRPICEVQAGSDPAQVGDEPLWLVRHTGCPVAVSPDRVAAARWLLQRHGCDLLLADDGLQHYRLGRDVEIVVIDGERRLGNGHCLPAGPLREPMTRLAEVDLVVYNGPHPEGGLGMALTGDQAVALHDADSVRPLGAFRGAPVHGVAGIGHPERFFSFLEGYGLEVVRHPFPDHHPFRPGDLQFGDGRAILMTGKDGVKCARFAPLNAWQVPVQAQPDSHLEQRLTQLIEALD